MLIDKPMLIEAKPLKELGILGQAITLFVRFTSTRLFKSSLINKKEKVKEKGKHCAIK
ncbi:hypothetical protein I876_07425 [Alteromonas mediterranea U7]|uniref:Uncharacterized protein n=1 Tax=Alteromonas mediterranea (strain DSM 17117 / CIP 110805 / LMG 28347 / Deep ecotype) TaxID=1774373 RepID=F2G8D6_ALTMD|nr:hypothetical protein MADE_1007825 [Alteromonas mediterranea DE]AGP85226.1 hypothetical protein I607_07130 [Alteromonas mediterranea U4]AGP89357.1 hypothetical protein I876_07425 [Alteromonas mediterranea U7]AGP93229.1 hypothetical protein I634_07545 [Alteromonas mediterranea U8]